MAVAVGSPFASSGTAQRLPEVKISGKLYLRLDDTSDTDRILFRKSQYDVVSADQADGFLNAGESIEFCGLGLHTAADISVISVSGTGNVYWGEA